MMYKYTNTVKMYILINKIENWMWSFVTFNKINTYILFQNYFFVHLI